jgi:nitrogen regulatory protein PII
MNGLSRLDVILSGSKIDELIQALSSKGIPGITVTNVIGCGAQRGAFEYEIDDAANNIRFLPKQMLTIFAENEQVDKFVEIINKALYTGHIGDGKIFISPVSRIIRIRTGEKDADALR